MLKRLRARSLRSRIVFLLVAAFVLGAGPAWAYWSASSPVTTAADTMGSLQVQVGSGAAPASFAASVSIPLNATAMYPGSSYVTIATVKNTGTIPATYWISVAGTGGLIGTTPVSLTTTVTLGTATTGSGATAHCATAGVTTFATTQAITATDTALSGMPKTQGSRRSLLVPNSSTESVCIEVAMPANAPSADQGKTASLTYTFNGTQVKATP